MISILLAYLHISNSYIEYPIKHIERVFGQNRPIKLHAEAVVPDQPVHQSRLIRSYTVRGFVNESYTTVQLTV